MKAYYVLTVVIMFFVAGCGVIVHGSKQDLQIETDPAGLTAVVAGKSCVTPCTLNVSRRNEGIRIIKHNGEAFHTELERKFIWWIIPANFFTYFIGVAVDHVTGAAWIIEDVNIKFPRTEALKEGIDKSDQVDNKK